MFCHVPGCSFWTSKSWRMERHKLCHSFETSPLDGGSNKRCYKCPDCHLKFFSLAKLLKHDRKKHTGVKDYECRICGAEVTDIQTHMRVIMLLATFQWIVIIYLVSKFPLQKIYLVVYSRLRDFKDKVTQPFRKIGPPRRPFFMNTSTPHMVLLYMIDYRFMVMKRTTSANIVP